MVLLPQPRVDDRRAEQDRHDGPERQVGPKRDLTFHPRATCGDQAEPPEGAGQERDEEPDEQPAPALVRQPEAENGGQLYVSHAHPPRRDECQHEEKAEGDGGTEERTYPRADARTERGRDPEQRYTRDE